MWLHIWITNLHVKSSKDPPKIPRLSFVRWLNISFKILNIDTNYYKTKQGVFKVPLQMCFSPTILNVCSFFFHHYQHCVAFHGQNFKNIYYVD
jgi:hypothetical protein